MEKQGVKEIRERSGTCFLRFSWGLLWAQSTARGAVAFWAQTSTEQLGSVVEFCTWDSGAEWQSGWDSVFLQGLGSASGDVSRGLCF